MDKKILDTLKELKTSISEIKQDMVTRVDAKQFLTKDDAKNFATKDDLKKFATKNDIKNFATKNDLKAALANHPTKEDLKNFATRDELFERFNKLDKMQMAIIESTDEAKEDKSNVDALENRVDIIEQKLAQ